MKEWKIYSKEGVEKYSVQDIEYKNEWMGEEYVLVNLVSSEPLSLEIGDYIVYRGLTYAVYNVPSAMKQARRLSYGEAFKYDNVKFSSLSAETTEVRFHDVVLYDNEIPYTEQTDFSFYCETVDDLIDRQQANMDRSGHVKWLFISPSRERTLQRYEQGTEAYQRAVQLWEYYFGGVTPAATENEKFDQNVSVSNMSVWDSFRLIKDNFGLNFITRDRVVVVASGGIYTNEIFRYGKDNGLAQIERHADDNQLVVTKLFAYGSDKNMPIHYYANVDVTAYMNSLGLYDVEIGGNSYVFHAFDVKYKSLAFTNRYDNPYDGTESNKILQYLSDEITVTDGTREFKLLVCSCPEIWSGYLLFGKVIGVLASNPYSPARGEIPYGTKLTIVEGVNPDKWPSDKIDRNDNNLPAFMFVQNLMLPGFPIYSLAQLCKSEYDSTNDKTIISFRKTPESEYNVLMELGGNHLIEYSDNPLRPYLLSPNYHTLGIKEGDIHFTEQNDDNGLKEVYPSIEGMTVGDIEGSSDPTPLDVLTHSDIVQDDGIRPPLSDGTFPNVKVTIPNVGFDLRKAWDEGDAPKMHFNTGYCGGMDFEMKNVKAVDGGFEVTLSRYENTLMKVYFPNSKNVSEGRAAVADEPNQLRGSDITGYDGDKYIFDGIFIGDTTYVEAASIKALKKAITWLVNNDYTRFTYVPKIDEIFMARQHDEAVASGGSVRSLHDTLTAGDIMLFEDSDLAIEGSVFIDSITIKENGNNGIPTYDVVLRNDKQVGSLERIQNRIDSIATSIASGGAGLNTAQVRELIKTYGGERFLSKISNDVAEGKITFAQGLESLFESIFNGIINHGKIQSDTADIPLFETDTEFSENVVIDKLLHAKSDAEIDGILRALAKILTNRIESSNWTGDGPFDTGFQLLKGNDGVTSMVVDNLFVRMKAIFTELEIRKVSYAGGNIIFSHAGSKVARVEPVYRGISAEVEGHKAILNGAVDVSGNTSYLGGGTVTGHKLTITNSQSLYAYRCYLLADDGSTRTENWWRVDDQARCQTFNIKEGVYQDVSNQFYWRRVIATGSETLEDGKVYDYVDLSAADCMQGSTVPQSGDQLVQMGNRTDTDRQGFISIEVSGDLAPAFKVYRGVNSYTLDGKRKICISPKLTEIRANKFIEETSYGVFVQPRQRDEEWYYGMQCYYYDLVQYDGATWLCIYPESGIGGVMYTTDKPSEDSPYWRIYAAKGKDGSDGKSFNILGSYDAEAELIAAHPTGEIGDAYIVAGYLYVWDAVNNRWHNSGQIKGDPGRGIRSAKISYGIGTATSLPSEWTDSVSELSIQPGDYLYVRTILYYTDNTQSDPSYSISRFGLDGAYKATAFCRTNKDISAQQLSGGTMENAVPNPFSYQGETITFTDGIPAGEAVVWAASNVFYGDGTQAGWTYARRMSDTATFDVEFSPNETKPANPSDDVSQREAQGWYDPTRNPSYDFTNSIWRAERHCKNGVWSVWAIEKIKGEDGASITKQIEVAYYIKNTTGVRPAENDPNWSETKPTLNKGEWLFTKTVITWSDGSTTVLYTDERNPNDGVNGQDIIVDGATVMEYAVSDNNVTQPTQWHPYAEIVSQIVPGTWLWSRATTYYRKASSAAGSHDAGSSVNYSVNYNGANGINGRAVKSITEYYKATNSSQPMAKPTSTTGWDDDPNLSHLTDKWNADHKYLWNMEKVEYTESNGSTTTEYTIPQILAIWTKDGAAGRGIDSIQNHYKITNSLTPPAKTGSGWSENPIAPTADSPYLWNYETISWTTGTPATTDTDVQMIGHYGKDGISVRAQYSADGTSWHDNFSTNDKWMRTSSDNGTTWSTAMKIVGENGSETDFSFGISAYKTTANAQTAPSDITSWSDAPMAVTDAKPYLWSKVVQKDGNGTTIGTSYIRLTGEEGAAGTSAATCFLDKSVVFVKVDTDGYVIDNFEEFVHFSIYRGTGIIAAKSAQVNEDGHQQYVELTGGKVTDMTGTTITVNNHTAIIHSGASVSGHKLTLTGNYVTSPNALRIRVQRGTLIDEHVATLQVIAEDADGNEYLCIAPMSIQREVIAKDGQNGADGKDGQPGAPGDDSVNVMLTPENVILEQNEDDESIIDLTKAYSVVSVNKGGAPDNNFTLSIIGRSNCWATVNNNTKRVTITQIDTHKEDPDDPSSDSIYYDNGYVDVRITYGGQNYDKRFGFYANLLGTWKRTTLKDAETVAANKAVWEMDDRGVPQKNTYDYNAVRDAAQSAETWHSQMTAEGGWIDQTNTRISTAEGNIATVTKKVDGGKNLLSGVITGSGWKSCEEITLTTTNYHNISVDDDGYFNVVTSSDRYLVSPLFNVEQGVKYTLSFYWNSGGTYQIGVKGSVTDIYTTGGSGGGITFRFTAAATEQVRVFIGCSSITRPQVEVGSVATSFDAGTTEITSQIKQTADGITSTVQRDYATKSQLQQTADGINASITNLDNRTQTALNLKANSADLTTMQDGLETAGVHLDGANSKIRLNASNVEVSENFQAKTVLTENNDAQVFISGGTIVLASKKSGNQSRIEFGVDDSGNCLLNYYDSNGNFKYGLGPDEIFRLKTQAEEFRSAYYCYSRGKSNCLYLTDAEIALIYRCVYKQYVSVGVQQYFAKIAQNIYAPGQYCNTAEDAARYDKKLIYQAGSIDKISDTDLFSGLATPITRVDGYILNDPSIDDADVIDMANYGYTVIHTYFGSIEQVDEGDYYMYLFNNGSTNWPVCRVYKDTGAIGYYNEYSGRDVLNFIENPKNPSELADPIYAFPMTYISNGVAQPNEVMLYINKSKLDTILANN